MRRHQPNYFDGVVVNKFNARRTVCAQSHNHPSRAESQRCDYHHLRVRAGELVHVDVWPTVTLSIGKYRPDFALWCVIPGTKMTEVAYEEVKGNVTRDFTLIRRAFDNEHPAAPLRVVRLRGKKWEEL